MTQTVDSTVGARPRMIIDDVLPNYDVIESHATFVAATPATVHRCARELDAGRMPLTTVLMTLRGIPYLLTGKVPPSRRMTFDDLIAFGFVILADDPPREIVLGVVGRFWLPTSGIVRIAAGEFAHFAEPGYARAAWNFRIDPRPGGCLLTTQTRVDCVDAAAQRRFRLYWAAVGPFSGLIRREMLRLIRDDAERIDAAVT
jgi:hypothetical protein